MIELSEKSKLRSAWGEFVGESRPGHNTFAVTLNFNPCTAGWAGPVHRVTRGGQRMAIHPGRGVGGTSPASLKGYRSIPVPIVHQRVYELWGRVDRILFGPRFHKSAVRTSYRGFIEHPESNVHVHLAWSVPGPKAFEFSELVAEEWVRLTVGGDCHAVPVSNAASWGGYCSKAQALGVSDARGEMFVESQRRT